MASPRSQISKRSSRKYSKAQILTPSILVASTLIINAFDSCQAAPRPVPTSDEYQRRWQRERARAYDDVDDIFPSWIEEEKRAAQQADIIARRGYPAPTALMKRSATTSSASYTQIRHAYGVSTGTGRNIVVPPAFASSIASSWDPRHRSVWFQRKAVIITSVFLAILIVLIIGAAAFIRDKREADAEGEVDVSDEAALKRMKKEREMRNGGKSHKNKKLELDRDDASIKTGGMVTATGVALRWVKVPVRRLKKRKGRNSGSVKNSSKENSVDDLVSPSPLHDSSNVASLSPSEETGSNIDERGVREDETTPVDSVQSTTDSQSIHPPSSNRDPLSVADLSAAEVELERLHGEEVDAFPPAYISRTRDELHPSANRQLEAGSSRNTDVLSMSEEKRPVLSIEPIDSIQGEESSLPSIAEGPSQEHYSGHVATDDKTLLGQLHHAASAPSAPEIGNEIGTSNDQQSSSQASAPILDITSAPEDDITEEELETIKGVTDKGKATRTMLPAPPRPLSSSSFSRFDMPYALENTTIVSPSSRTMSKTSSEKDQEAEEERRSTMALIESKPEDMVHLPKYESAQQIASAPASDDYTTPPLPALSIPSAPSAPSAPPTEE